MNTGGTLYNRNFVLLWLGQAVSGFGTMFYSVAMLFWIKDNYSSATLMGSMLLTSSLPGVLLSPIGGTIADLFSRRAIILIADFVRGMAMLTLVGVLWMWPEKNGLILSWIFGIALLNGVTSAIFQPAITAAIADLVPPDKLLKANSLRQFSGQTVMLTGQGLGGLAYAFFGPLLLFLFNGISFLVSWFSELFITIPQKKIEKKETTIGGKAKVFLKETGEGFRYVWKNPGMRLFFAALAAVNFLLAPLSLLLPFFVEDFLHLNAAWYGYLIASVTLGSMSGLWIFNMINANRFVRQLALIMVLPMAAMAFGLVGVFIHPGIAMGLFFTLGISVGIFNLNVNTILQLTTPSHLRGRVFGLVGTISRSLQPVSIGLTGIITDALERDIPKVYALYGAILLVMAVLMLLSPSFRKFLFYTHKEEPQPVAESQANQQSSSSAPAEDQD